MPLFGGRGIVAPVTARNPFMKPKLLLIGAQSPADRDILAARFTLIDHAPGAGRRGSTLKSVPRLPISPSRAMRLWTGLSWTLSRI